MRSSNITRRSFVTAAAALPLAAASTASSPTMVRLSSYMSEAGSQPLPEEALEKTKQHILDTFAAMVSGSQLAPGRFAINFARAHSAEKTSTVVASDVVCGAIEAAFSNAMLAHSDETDDSHAPSESHPGASVVPAALATGEQFNIDGPRFLRAVALGYDVGTRFTMAVGAGGFETATHLSTHALSGTFGSAAAAGCAAGLNEQQMRWLIDYASQQASGIKTWQRDTEHIEKAFLFAGMPARNGVTAALLVQAGATGVDDVLSGQDNFLADYAPQADPTKLIEKLGERFEVTRTNIKKWTVGSPIQAPLDALEIILKRRPFEPDQVQAVTVRVATSEASLVTNREMPDICMQHMVAVMLIDKTASFKAARESTADTRHRTRAPIAGSRRDRRSNAGRWNASHRNRQGCPRYRRKSNAARRSDRQGARSCDARSRRGPLRQTHRGHAPPGKDQIRSRIAPSAAANLIYFSPCARAPLSGCPRP